jgi:hypothetical protein
MWDDEEYDPYTAIKDILDTEDRLIDPDMWVG